MTGSDVQSAGDSRPERREAVGGIQQRQVCERQVQDPRALPGPEVSFRGQIRASGAASRQGQGLLIKCGAKGKMRGSTAPDAGRLSVVQTVEHLFLRDSILTKALERLPAFAPLLAENLEADV